MFLYFYYFSPTVPSKLWPYLLCLWSIHFPWRSSAKCPSRVPDFSSCITALGHVPGLFSGGLKFLLRGLPRFHVLFENVPDIFFLEPFLFQENFNFFAHPFEFSEAIGQFNILSLCPLYFDTSIPPLVSIFFLSFCWLSLYLLCHAAFLSLMCCPAPWKTSVMSFHQKNFWASLVHCSWEL